MRNLKLIIATAFMLSFAYVFADEAKNIDNLDSLAEYKTPSITVSANKAEKRKSPVPFEEITQSEIAQMHTGKDITLLLSEMPSIITYSESGNFMGYNNIKMRGFDQRRIAVMVNGVPQNDPEDHNMYWINLADLTSSLDNIQVQRGAGVSTYGAAAIGGSINLTTSDFVKQKGVKLYSGVGYQTFDDEIRANTSKLAFEASSGLIDEKYAVYGRLTRMNSWGYRNQSWAFMNGWFLSAARFDNNFSTQINVYGGNQYDGLVYNGIPKNWNSDLELRRSNYSYWEYGSEGKEFSWGSKRRDVAIEEFAQPHYEILNDWQINNKLQLKSTLFYYSGEGYFDFSGAGWTDSTTFYLTPEYGWEGNTNPDNALIRAFVGNKHGGWIPRLIWKGDRHETTLGMEIRLHRSDHWGKIEYAEDLPSGFDPNYKFYEYQGERDIFSVFGSERYYLTDKFILSGEAQLVRHSYRISDEILGGRYSQYNTVDGGTVSGDGDLFEVNYLFFNPRVGANYNFTDAQNAYLSFAFTQREPRMKNLYDASDAATGGATPLFEKDTTSGDIKYDFDKPIVEPEKMFNVEAGWSFRNPKYYLNLNFYWMEYFDELVKSGQLDIFGQPVDGNAPRTRHYGIELSGSAILYNSLKYGNIQIAGNFTYSQNPIIDFDYITSNGEEISLNDNSIAGFPDIMGNMRLTYSLSDFYFSLLMKHVGEFRTDNFGDMLTENQTIMNDLSWGYYSDNTNDAYTVLNANINYTFRELLGLNSLKLQLQVINLTNELYMQNGIGKEFFPAAERSAFIGIEMGL